MEQPDERPDRQQERGILRRRDANGEGQGSEDHIDPGGPCKSSQHLRERMSVQQLVAQNRPHKVAREVANHGEYIDTNEPELDTAWCERGKDDDAANVRPRISEAPDESLGMPRVAKNIRNERQDPCRCDEY